MGRSTFSFEAAQLHLELTAFMHRTALRIGKHDSDTRVLLDCLTMALCDLEQAMASCDQNYPAFNEGAFRTVQDYGGNKDWFRSRRPCNLDRVDGPLLH